jgi:FkbM family methyltransferase
LLSSVPMRNALGFKGPFLGELTVAELQKTPFVKLIVPTMHTVDKLRFTASTVLKGLPQPWELLSAHQRTPATHKLIASYLHVLGQGFPVEIPLRGGGSIRIFSREEARVFWQIFVRGCYRIWDDCRTIIDAGANVGMFAVWAARQLPEARIFALEPFPETFARLQQNVYLNRLNSRIDLSQVALAAQPTKREMLVEPASPRRSLVPSDVGTTNAKTVPVSCVTLADLIAQYEPTGIDMVKMDIEGSEWEVLFSTPPALLRCIRRLQFEYHEVHVRFGYSKEALLAHLAKAGFHLTHQSEDKYGTGIAIVEQELPSHHTAPLVA